MVDVTTEEPTDHLDVAGAVLLGDVPAEGMAVEPVPGSMG
jgi:hypothetical protein